MDRREFITTGALGTAGMVVGAAVPWLSPAAAFAAGNIERASGHPWKFGVMADTQWGKNLDGLNPGTCAVGIINALNAEFVARGAKFVIQVGDLVDKEDDASNGHAGLRTMPVRAAAAETLYANGIGFFPCRGNHEGSVTAANEFARLYPQTRGYGEHLFGAKNFSSPSNALSGLSYSFDVGNVRIVGLDQFVRADGTGANNVVTTVVDNNIVDQQAWIDETLSGRSKDTHAFVFSHKNLIGQNHVDCLFGANPSTNPDARNAFIKSMQANGVRYVLGGHDHMHHRSIVTSPDGSASVKEIICASDSYKFYYPAQPSNDATFDAPSRELTIAQELDNVGYYLFTVDGPRVTVDYYSAAISADYGTPTGVEDKLLNTPAPLVFYRRETFGYSLNGREFIVPQGGTYTVVADSFRETSARILSGTNGNTAKDASGRALVKTVNTGWARPQARETHLASYVLTLWGTADNLSLYDETLTGVIPNADRPATGDTYAIAMTYEKEWASGIKVANGHFGIGNRDARGNWANAVNRNTGGHKQFVAGPYNASYGLGTYGIDTATRTAWAVVNYDGDFAVATGL